MITVRFKKCKCHCHLNHPKNFLGYCSHCINTCDRYWMFRASWNKSIKVYNGNDKRI